MPDGTTIETYQLKIRFAHPAGIKAAERSVAMYELVKLDWLNRCITYKTARGQTQYVQWGIDDAALIAVREETTVEPDHE